MVVCVETLCLLDCRSLEREVPKVERTLGKVLVPFPRSLQRSVVLSLVLEGNGVATVHSLSLPLVFLLVLKILSSNIKLNFWSPLSFFYSLRYFGIGEVYSN